VRETHERNEFSRISIEAYTTPSVLLNNRFSSCCPETIVALTSSDTSVLLHAWKKLSESHPENPHIMEEYNIQNASKDRVIFARINLMFAWWNRALDMVYRIDERTINYYKLFRAVKETDCQGSGD
jgi:hypothetical protein